MNDVVGLNSFTLDSGAVVRSIKSNATSYSMYRVAHYSVLVDGLERPFLKTTDSILFDFIEEGAYWVLNQSLRSTQPKDMPFSFTLFDSAAFTDEIADMVAREIENLEFTPEERFLLACVLYNSPRRSHKTVTDKIVHIVRQHIKMVAESDAESIPLKSVIDPYNSRLGFEYRTFLEACDFDAKQFEFFETNPHFLELLNRFIKASNDEFAKKDDKISEISADFDLAKPSFLQDCILDFMDIPWHYPAIRQLFETLTVREFRQVFVSMSSHSSEDRTLELLTYRLNNFRNASTVETLLECNELYNKIFNKFITVFDPPSDVTKISGTIFMYADGREAFRRVLSDYIDRVDSSKFAGMRELSKISIALAPSKSENDWISDHYLDADFILDCLEKKIGGYATVKTILRAHDEKIWLKFDQWMEVVDRIDELIDVPVLWWKIMVGDDIDLRKEDNNG